MGVKKEPLVLPIWDWMDTGSTQSLAEGEKSQEPLATLRAMLYDSWNEILGRVAF